MAVKKKIEKPLTLENYLFNFIEKRRYDLKILEKNKKDYSEKDYWCLFHRYNAGISDLYLCLSGYKNPLAQIDIFWSEVKNNNL